MREASALDVEATNRPSSVLVGAPNPRLLKSYRTYATHARHTHIGHRREAARISRHTLSSLKPPAFY